MALDAQASPHMAAPKLSSTRKALAAAHVRVAAGVVSRHEDPQHRWARMQQEEAGVVVAPLAWRGQPGHGRQCVEPPRAAFSL